MVRHDYHDILNKDTLKIWIISKGTIDWQAFAYNIFSILGITCQDHEFACANHKCIHESLKCNYEDDCGDNSDEMNCRDKVKFVSKSALYKCWSN